MTERFCAAAPAVAHVFVDDVSHEDDVWIDGDDGHHLQRVRRLREGEALTVSDGRGSWRLGTVVEAGDRTLRLAWAGPLEREPVLTPRIVIAFAPAKGDHAGTVVRQLVELGVDAVMPITLHRSVVRVDGPQGDRVRARMTRVVREAAMQSRRARIPEVLASEELAVLARHRGLVVATPDGAPASSVIATTSDELLVVVGPEGGIDPNEGEVLARGVRLAVGPHVLRAVTAPVAALAALAGFRTTLTSDFTDFLRKER